MAPTPIYVDLPPFDERSSATTISYFPAATGKSLGLATNLLAETDKALDDFARNNADTKANLKELIIRFFSNNQVNLCPVHLRHYSVGKVGTDLVASVFTFGCLQV